MFARFAAVLACFHPHRKSAGTSSPKNMRSKNAPKQINCCFCAMSNQTNGKSMQKPWQSGHNIQSQVLLPDGILLNTGSRFFRLNTGPRCQGQRHFRTPAHTFAITLLTVLAIFLLGLLRPAAAETATSGARLEIFASILPQKFLSKSSPATSPMSKSWSGRACHHTPTNPCRSR